MSAPALTVLEGGAEVVGALPGLVPCKKWSNRLLDLYDLAHHAHVYGVEITDQVVARVKSKERVSWNQVARLLTFARSVGIGMAADKDEEGRVVLRFWDARAAQARCNELLDAIEQAGCRQFRLLESMTSMSCA